MNSLGLINSETISSCFGFIFKEHSSAKELYYSDCIWQTEQDAEDYAYLSVFGRINRDKTLDKIYKKASIH